VRTTAEFRDSKIDEAISLTFDRLVGQAGCPVPSDTDIVVICRSGFRAGIAASLLEAKGCKRVSVLSGGMNAWSNRRK